MTSDAALPRTPRISCGVLLFNHKRELLVAHVTGQDRWDVPKGILDEGELPLNAAVREAWEETGVMLPAQTLTEVGRVPYLPEKALHLFAAAWPYESLELGRCHCSSFFDCKKSGTKRPEVNGYKWITLEDIPEHCGKSLSRALLQELDLHRIAESVQFEIHA